jgi:hypothetical protein
MVWKLLFGLLLGHNQIMQTKISQDFIPNPQNKYIGIHKNPYVGYDERYVHYYGNTTKYGEKIDVSVNSELLKIANFMEKLKKIKELENKKSEFHHPHLQENIDYEELLDDPFDYCSIHPIRMKKGGLLSDW